MERLIIAKTYEDGYLKEIMVLVNKGIVERRFNYIDKNLCRDYECIDLRAKGILLPGFIDIHVHLRGLKLSYKEDEESGTKAASRGGFTAVVDMPNTLPRIDNKQALQEKIEALKLKSRVDFGIYVSPAKDYREMYDMLYEEGVVGVKFFPQDLHLFPKILNITSSRDLNRIVIVHAEHPYMVNDCEAGSRWMCRPIESELSALDIVHMHVKENMKIHITHITNVLTLSLAKRYKFTTDTCPHYLYLDSSHEKEMGCIAKVNPPLRTPSTRYSLLKLLKAFDAVSSDHAPHSFDEKLLDFSMCPSGIASLELTASLILNLVNLGAIDLDDAVKLLSRGPSKILGLKRWGCTYIGCIASYTVVDMNKEFRVDPETFYSKSRFSPYKKNVLKGVATATIVRGGIVYIDEGYEEKIEPEPLTKFMVN
ncbi:MAG: dihydroorotase [Ignisphaera sp.]